MKKLLITLLLLFTSTFLFSQSDYYWVGGSGSWSDLNHWVTASGGSTNYGVLPGSTDDVFFDANSFSANDEFITMDVLGVCNNINWTAITFSVSIEKGTDDEIEIYGSMALSNSVEIGNDIDLTFLSAGAEVFSMGDDLEVRKNHDNGRSRINFQGDGTWTVVDHITTRGSINLSGNATLDLDGNNTYSEDLAVFSPSSLVTGDNATLTFEDWVGTTNNLSFGTGVEMIMEQFNLFDSFGDFKGFSKIYPSLTLNNTGQPIRFDGGNTFEDLTIAAGVTVEFENGKTQTVTNFIAVGDKNNVIKLTSDSNGNQATISQSAGTINADFLDLTDMVATGGATFNANNSLDGGNNSGWNITAPVGQVYYWIGDGGDWTDLSHWATTSGGSTLHTTVPGFIDDAIFDANSFSIDNQSIDDGDEIDINDIDFSAVTNEPEMGITEMNVFGSISLGSGVAIKANTGVFLNSSGSETITSNNAAGISWIEFSNTGIYTITDKTHMDNLTIGDGATIIADNQELSIVSFSLDANGTFSALNATISASRYFINGSATHTLTGSALTIGAVQFLSGATSSFPSLSVFFASSAITFGDVIFDGQIGFAHGVELNFADWTIASGSEIVFSDFTGSASVININSLVADGTSIDHIILRSDDPGTRHFINSTSGTTVNTSWLELTDNEVSGATFNATNSFDNGNNSGWAISAPPNVPDAPTNLSTTPIASEEFTANWDAVTGADSYRIDVARDLAFTVLEIEDQTVNATSLMVTGLTASFDYYWRVRAVNISGVSSNSATESITTLPEPPLALDAESIFADKFTAKWQAVSGADDYRLDVATDVGFAQFESGYQDLTVLGISQEVSGLSEGITYYYRVRAVSATGTTGDSNIITVATTIKQDQTIIFDLDTDAIKSFGDEDFMLTGSSTSGLDITYESSDLTVATVLGDLITIIGAGTSTITASQDGNASFNAASPVMQLLTVNKAQQTITFDPNPIPSQNLSVGTVSVDIAIDSGLPLTVSITDGPATVMESATPGTYEITLNGSGTVTIEAAQTGDDNYGPEVQSRSFNVIDDVLDDQTITFDLGADATKTFGDDSFDLTVSATSGLSVLFTSSDDGVATILGNQVTIIGAGTVDITATQAGDETFNPAPQVVQELVINKADQVISFSAISDKIIGDDPFQLVASSTSDLEVEFVVANFSIASVEGNLLTIVGGGTTDITASQAGDNNYNSASEVIQSLTVNKIIQTITITEIPDKIITDPSFDVEASVDSGLGLAYEVSGPASISGISITLTGAAGTVTVTVSQAGTSSYNSASEQITFEVNDLQSQTITFAALADATFGDADITLSATSDSGLEVSYISSDESVATVSGSTLTILTAGSTEITASQSGDGTFNSAMDVAQTLNVYKADQTITFGDLTDVLVGATVDLTASTTSGLAIVFDVTGPATLSESALTTTGLGTVTVTARQGGNDNYNSAPDVSQSFEVTEEVVAGIEDQIGFKVYPNPTQSLIKVEGEDLETLYILSLTGKQLNQVNIHSSREVNLSHLQSGFYILRVETRQGDIIYRRILKAN